MQAKNFQYPRVLSVAGSDSGGGAGIQADLKTFSALGCYGMTAITALTAQNTRGVRAIQVVPARMLRAQMDAVLEDMGTDAVKIGMLPSPALVRVVADAIDRHALTQVVLDPVMVSSSGTALMAGAAVDLMVRTLFSRVAVITPNLDEAGLLLGRVLRTTQDMEQAAVALLATGVKAVVLKGGHLPGEQVADLLLTQSGEKLWVTAPRIASTNTHGTGCTLSSAMAACLAQGADLHEALRHAHDFVRSALQAGLHARTGQGKGPLNHGHAPLPMRRHDLP